MQTSGADSDVGEGGFPGESVLDPARLADTRAIINSTRYKRQKHTDTNWKVTKYVWIWIKIGHNSNTNTGLQIYSVTIMYYHSRSHYFHSRGLFQVNVKVVKNFYNFP